MWWILGLRDPRPRDGVVQRRGAEAQRRIFSGVTSCGDSSIECVSKNCAFFFILFVMCMPGWTGDWPQLGFDGQHSSNSPEELAARLGVRWEMKLPRMILAWPDQNRL